MGDLQVVGQAESGDQADHDRAQGVHGQDHLPSGKAVDERAAEQDGHELSSGEEREAHAKLQRRSSERQDLKGQSHGVDRVPDDRDRLADEQEPEIAVAQRRQDLQTHRHRMVTVGGSASYAVRAATTSA
jgi:hypothetical protein